MVEYIKSELESNEFRKILFINNINKIIKENQLENVINELNDSINYINIYLNSVDKKNEKKLSKVNNIELILKRKINQCKKNYKKKLYQDNKNEIFVSNKKKTEKIIDINFFKINYENKEQTIEYIDLELKILEKKEKKEFLIKILDELINKKKNIQNLIKLSNSNDNLENYKNIETYNYLIDYVSYQITKLNNRKTKIIDDTYNVAFYKEQKIEYLYQEMKEDSPIIIDDVLNYIKAFDLFLFNIDINEYISTIKNRVIDIQKYIMEEEQSNIIQKYYISYLLDVLKKYKRKQDKKTIERIEFNNLIKLLEKDYIKLDKNEVNINDIKIYDIVEIEDLIKNSKKDNYKLITNELSKKYNILSSTQLIFSVLNYLKKKILIYDFNSNYIDNKYLLKISKYLIYLYNKLDEDISNLLESKLLEIEDMLYLNIKQMTDTKSKSLLKNIYDDLIFLQKENEKYKLINKKKKLDNNYEIRYIISKVKSIDFLILYLNNDKESINYDLFNEILEKYFNTVINSNDYNLILYYQKVIETIINYSKLDKNVLINIIESRIEKYIEKDSFNKRKDYIKRLEYLKNTLLVLNKSFSYKEIINCIKPSKEKYENITVITIDSPNTNIFENAFSINRKNDDLIDFTLYTSDISNYLLQKGNENKLLQFIGNKNVNLENEKNKYSLNENEKRDVIAYKFIIDNNMNIVWHDIYKTNIMVTKNIFYDSSIEDILKNTYSSIERKDLTIKRKLCNSITLLYYLGTRIIQKSLGSKYNNDNFEMKKNEEFKVFSIINTYVTNYCNKNITNYFNKLGYHLVNKENVNTLISKIESLDSIEYKVKEEKKLINNLIVLTKNDSNLYNISCHNLLLEKSNKVTSPMRQFDALLNQLLTYYYHNYEISEETKNILDLELNSLLDIQNIFKNKELKNKHKNKVLKNELTKNK